MAAKPKSKRVQVLTGYRVTGQMVISVYVDVRAASEEEAKAKAAELPTMSLCYQCASGHADEWSTSGDLDGAVEITGARVA